MRSVLLCLAVLMAVVSAAHADQVYVHVSNGFVDNRAIFSGAIPDDWQDRPNWFASDTAQIGWQIVSGVLTAPSSEEPAPSTNAVDYVLQKYQFDAMLDIAGLLSTVDAAINAIPDPVQRAVARARYKDTQTFYRNDSLLNQLATAGGLTPEQVDAYWMQAKDL